VQLVYEYFTIYDPGIGILQVCPALPQRLYFSALEHEPGFVFIDDKIIATGLTVLGNDFDVFFFQRWFFYLKFEPQ
jgi:hypothetical protein